MTAFQALVLGLVQGLSEFLPISSSAHLTLTPWLLRWPDPGLASDVALHVGTLVAVALYFRREWFALIRSGIRMVQRGAIETPEERRVLFLVIATIPAAVAGLLLQSMAEHAFRSPRLIAAALFAMGLALWLVDRASRRNRPLPEMRWADALWIGLAQALALVPGVSRSGATITASRALGFDRQSAAVFSFLMSFPVIAAAAVLEAPRAVHAGGPLAPLLVGVTSAAISSAVAIALLLRFVLRHSYGIFALYRVLLAGAVLLVVAARG